MSTTSFNARIHLHGIEDNDVPIASGEQAIDFWIDFNNTDNVASETVENGIKIEHFSYTGEDDILLNMIGGGSHSTFDDIDFNGSDSRQLIWDFVSRQQLNND